MVSDYTIKSRIYDINISKTVLLMISVSLAVFAWSFSAGAVNISLPVISQYMDISTYMASWIVIIHLLVLTSFLLIFGRLGDVIGLKKVFLSGLIVFTLSSYLCGLSLELVPLLIFRGLQGLGSAMLLSMTPALVSHHLKPESQAKGFAAISASTTLALAAGYGIGGIALVYLDWNWIFFLTVPLGVLAGLAGYYYIPSDKPSVKKMDFDLMGAFFTMVTLIILILSVYCAKDWGLTSPWFIGGLLFFIILLIALIRWESREKNPIFNLEIIKNLKVFVPLLVAFLMTMVFMGTVFLIPFYLNNVMKYDSSFSGMLILIPTMLVMVASPISGVITDKYGSRIPTIIACVLLLTFLSCFILMNKPSGILIILIVLSFRFLSEGFFAPANNKQAMGNGQIQKGTLSSLLNTAKYLGIIIGVVVFDAIFESTIILNTTNLVDMPDIGAFHLAAPTHILLSGFHNAFLFGLIITAVVLMLVFKSSIWKN